MPEHVPNTVVSYVEASLTACPQVLQLLVHDDNKKLDVNILSALIALQSQCFQSIILQYCVTTRKLTIEDRKQNARWGSGKAAEPLR